MAGGVIRHATGDDRASALRRIAAAEPGTTWMDPEVCRRNPLLAVRLRRSILMRCYNGDYHTDVFDEERLAGRIADGSERVLFWGPADQVSRTAELFHAPGCPPAEVLDGLSLGTHTSLPGEELYGRGHVEVARTGSTQGDSAGAADAILWDLGRVLAGARRGEELHTISCVPRNRRSAHGVPGGAAIHRLHTRAVGSRHWGVAPFYVMAGGSLEVLDYRELSFEETYVRQGFDTCGTVHVSDTMSASLAADLCELNGFDVDIRTTETGPLGRRDAVAPAPPGDAHGPRVTHMDLDAPERTLAEAAADRGEACTVAVCNLNDARSLPLQAALVRDGFRLTYISPPKLVPSPEGHRSIPLRGGFCRIRTDAPLAAPYYLERGPLSDTERKLAAQYRDLLGSWRKETTPNE
ncbi:hypothetical protein OHA46_24970 [Streptomyces sp. NBC_00708]